jgi:putative NADH-flavin reductase
MNIAVIGATGRIGQRIVAEALQRGHHVTAFTSQAAKIPAEKGKAAWKTADVMDPVSVAQAMEGQDVLISSYGPAMGADPKPIATAAEVLLKAAETHPKVRVIMVGGAGSLEVAPGKTVIDAGMIPAEYIAIPIAHKHALETLKKNSTAQWTYFSPAAMIQPGVRTGKFRLGGDQLIVGENGKSEISMEDYAVAMIDEAERPQHLRKRFTIGY